MTTEVVSPAPCALGEGPYWDPQENLLRYVDIVGGDVYSLNPMFKESRKIHVGDYSSFVIPRSANNNELIVGANLNIVKLNWKMGTTEIIAKLDQEWQKQETRMNDAKCDAKGRLWMGTMFLISDLKKYQMDKAAFYCLDEHHDLKQKLPCVSLSNGIAWTSDNTTMFYIDSMKRSVSAFDFDLENAEISSERTAINLKEFGDDIGYPDGMTMDTDGKLWIACFDGGRVIKCDPETGRVLQTLTFPVSRVTSCCFGGPDFRDLYVTTVYDGLNEAEMKAQPLAGHVFKVSGLGVKGTPDYTYAG